MKLRHWMQRCVQTDIASSKDERAKQPFPRIFGKLQVTKAACTTCDVLPRGLNRMLSWDGISKWTRPYLLSCLPSLSQYLLNSDRQILAMGLRDSKTRDNSLTASIPPPPTGNIFNPWGIHIRSPQTRGEGSKKNRQSKGGCTGFIV